jgi:hypothetical protein
MGNKETVLNLFFDNPTQGFSLRELERRARLGLPSVIRYIGELRKEQLLVGKKFGNSELLYANQDNAVFRRRKVFRNVERIYDSGLIDFINEQCAYPTIVLFGSKSRGEDIETSDCDLFVQAPERELPVERFLPALGSVHLLIRQNVCDFSNQHLIANIINGIVLEGYLDVEALFGRVPRAADQARRRTSKVSGRDRTGAARVHQKHAQRRQR